MREFKFNMLYSSGFMFLLFSLLFDIASIHITDMKYNDIPTAQALYLLSCESLTKSIQLVASI